MICLIVGLNVLLVVVVMVSFCVMICVKLGGSGVYLLVCDWLNL